MAKAKGTALLGAVKYLRRQGDRARDALPAHLHRYLEERILPASWYPEQDLLDLLGAVARLLPDSGPDVHAQMGRISARDHMESFYGHLFQHSEDPLSLPRKAFALWTSMHDTGRLRIDMEDEGRARVELIDYAIPCREMCGIMTGYVEETLRLSGFAEPRLEKQRCRVRGDDACVWEARWRAAPADSA